MGQIGEDFLAVAVAGERIAVIRGTKDKLTGADAALLTAGGERIERLDWLPDPSRTHR